MTWYLGITDTDIIAAGDFDSKKDAEAEAKIRNATAAAGDASTRVEVIDQAERDRRWKALTE